MQKSREILLARVLSLVPEKNYVSASSLAKQYSERFREEISTAKISSLLAVLIREGIVSRTAKHRHFGILWAYAKSKMEKIEDDF